MKLKTIKLKKFIIFSKKLPRILAGNSFLTFLALTFFAAVFGGLVFYKYSILSERTKPEVSQEVLNFNEKNFQEVLKIWDERQQRTVQIDAKTYPNPFKEAAATSTLTR